MSKLDELLQGVDVEWRTLGDICIIKTGQSINKIQIDKNPGIYPVINSGKEPLGYIKNWNTENDPIGIASRGAGVGQISWNLGKYFRGNLNYSVTILDKSFVINKFLYYLLLSMQTQIHSLCTFDGIPALNSSKLKKLLIPIPPIEIQQEIVRVLDELTSLTNQLTTELETERQNRKKQFEFFREQFFRFEEGELDLVKLGDLCKIASGKNKDKSDNGKYILYGSTGIIGKTDVKKFDSERILVARVGANAGFVYIADGEYDVSDNALVIEKSEKVLTKFLYYFLFNMNLNQFAKGAGQPLITGTFLKNIYISIPPLEEQKRIVKLLDQFDATHSAIEEEITKEIKLRTQQYEYYREKLLSFPQNN